MKEANYTNKIIIGLLLILVLTGCSQQYKAEKAFYWASKYSEDIFKDPKNIPPFKFDKALAEFQAVIDKYPQTDQAIQSHLLIANLYIIKEKYQDAISVFQKMLTKYTENRELQAKTMISIGACYEKMNDWDNAYKNYRAAFEKYPDTKSALQVPAYILAHYLGNKDKENAELAYQQALQDYKKLMADVTNPQAAYGAGNMLAECYMRMGDWADLLATLHGMVNKYPQSPEAPVWLMTMGATYDVKLKDIVKAREMYQAVKDKYSQSPWAKEADKRLQALK